MTKIGPFTRESGGETHPARAHKPRRYRRFALDSRIKVFRAGHPHPLFGRTLGVSEAGISALLAADLEVGESVHLEFTLLLRVPKPGSAGGGPQSQRSPLWL